MPRLIDGLHQQEREQLIAQYKELVANFPPHTSEIRRVIELVQPEDVIEYSLKARAEALRDPDQARGDRQRRLNLAFRAESPESLALQFGALLLETKKPLLVAKTFMEYWSLALDNLFVEKGMPSEYEPVFIRISPDDDPR